MNKENTVLKKFSLQRRQPSTFVTHLQQKIARVLHAPLDVRNHETGGGDHFTVLDLGAEVKRHLVTRAMDLEGAVDVELRFAARRQFPADAVRR